MNLITVIPIQKGIGKETLTYFTSSKIELGSLVEVPLRKKIVDALVISSEDARSMKSEIKNAAFTLRKMDKLVSKPFISKEFMQTVQETARYHAATTGATLNVLLPKKVIEGLLSSSPSPVVIPAASQAGTQYSKNMDPRLSCTGMTESLTDRIAYYHSLIKKQKTVIIVPTKEKQSTFKKIFKDTLVLLPSSLIEIPLDASLIIIEESKSNSYKSIARPFIDFCFALETFALYIGAKIIKGDSSLQPHTKKILESNEKEGKKAFTVIGNSFSKELAAIKRNKSGHLFVLGTRTGHSGVVLCQDCGHTLNCLKCNTPLTLHLKKEYEEYNSLLCHHCGFKETALKACASCGSWRLKSFGVGIEKILEDVKAICEKHNVQANITRIDSTLKLTPKKIRGLVAEHYRAERSVLIATEMILPYLAEAAIEGIRNEASCIPSLDSLLSIPDFSISAKLWKIFCSLDDVTSGNVIIQTKNTSNQLLIDWKNNAEAAFHAREMEERKMLRYPPYNVFIKLSARGKKERISREMKDIETQLFKWKPSVFPAFIKTIKNEHILHALVSIPADEWVNEELLQILLSLPPSVSINVNPTSLL